MRTKEEAADYRYFRDPDLSGIEITENTLSATRAMMPELPNQKFDRYIIMGLSPYEAEILTEEASLARYFEDSYTMLPNKQIVNWILRDVLGYVKEKKIDLAACKVTPKKLASIVAMLLDGTINNSAAKKIFDLVAEHDGDPNILVKEHKLEQVGSSDALEAIVKKIVETYPKEAAELKSGKDRLFGFFVGQVMKETQGKGNPQIIQELLKKFL
jgi:aspartyl-tRNA(Asn)/glutamyl-tRNA(Gln) amidotransferase subunit B